MTTHGRITLIQAAELAGVTTRTVLRWKARGLLTVQHGGWQEPALYDSEEVIRVALRPTRTLHLPEPA